VRHHNEEVDEVAEQTLLSDGVTLYDPEQWLDKVTAAGYVGATTRTLERWIGKRLHPLSLRQPAKHPITVFAKAELGHIREERRAEVTPAQREPSSPTPTPRQGNVAIRNGHAVPSTFPSNPTLPTDPTPLMSAMMSGLALAPILLEKGVDVDVEEAKRLTRWTEKAPKQAVEEKRIQRALGRTWFLRTIDLLRL
jgi:hypothetical protein